MYSPTLEQVRAYADRYRTVPVSRMVYADIRTPIEVMRILKSVSRHCYMLESMEDAKRWGRYTFLGFDPKLEITCTGGEVHISAGTEMTVKDADPAQYIRQVLRENKSPRIPGLPPFTGGLAGYFSYDYITYGEPSLKLDAPEENYKKAVGELDDMVELVTKGTPAVIPPLSIKSEFRPLFGEKEYCRMVETAKSYIREGDIFQVVLSNRLEAEVKGSLFDTYRVLRTTNPSPYMFYFGGGDIEIAGASPETLVRLENGKLYTFPLAGTRPRGKTQEEDRELERELLADPKERAEHNMLVDLGRNDLGKISRFGTVKVEKYMETERFSHVMHIGSTVSGQIRDDKDALDAVGALLPAGTLSGAPKLRACEIIHALENCKRGIYGGAIGYIDFTGNMDTCIAIRIAFRKNGKVFVRSGAGIVADSVPEKEYRECIHKAQAVMDALRTAEGGIGG